jgi:hypothetical protein
MNTHTVLTMATAIASAIATSITTAYIMISNVQKDISEVKSDVKVLVCHFEPDTIGCPLRKE